jgi:hypothetical protein
MRRQARIKKITPVGKQEREMILMKNIENNNIKYVETPVKESFFTDYFHRVQEIVPVPNHTMNCILKTQLSMALSNARYYTKQGPVRASIGHLWLGPSGSNKTGARRYLEKTFLYLNPPRDKPKRLFSKHTPHSILANLNKVPEGIKFNGSPYAMAIIRDEASTLAKENRSGALSSTFEIYAEIMDNEVQDSGTTGRGNESYPEILYCTTWLTSTPIFLSHLSDQFWEQGIGFRFFYVKDEAPLRYNPLGGDGDTISKEILDDMSEKYFKILIHVRNVDATDEFKRKYVEYVDKLQVDRIEAHKNKDESMEVKATTKFQGQVLQLSMIHAASRVRYSNNYEELQIPNCRGDCKETILTMDTVDLENAIKDLEEYKDVFLDYYRQYQDRKRQAWNPAKITRIIEQIKRAYYDLIKDKKGYSVESVKDQKAGFIGYTAAPDKDGKWISQGYISQKLGMSMVDVKTALDSMVESGITERVTAKTKTKSATLIKIVGE